MQSSTWSGLERPAGITFVAAAGLIVGCVSILASVGVAIIALGAGMGSSSQAGRILALAPAALPISTADQPTSVRLAMSMPPAAPEGTVSEQDRVMIAAVLGQRVAMSESQIVQLNGLLSKMGQRIFPNLKAASRAEAIDREILEVGHGPGRANQTPPVYFTSSGGRTELRDDGAVFYPTDGSPTVRASAGPRVNDSGHPVLGPEDRQALVQAIGQLSANRFTPGQITTLYEMLGAPDQQLVAAQRLNGQWVIGINGATSRPDGYALIQFAGGPLLLSPRGRVVLSSDSRSVPRASMFACGLAALEAAGSIAMAVWLIIISLGLQHQKLVSPAQHRLWSWIKLPLTATGAIVLGWMFAGVLAAAPQPRSGVAPKIAATTAGAFFGIGFGLAGLAYPVVTLIVLRSRASELYFDGVR